jgi:hypothetical protein
MSKIKYVYVAGPLRPKGYRSQCMWIDYLLNVRENIRYAVAVAKLGYVPFCPCLDFLYLLVGVGVHRLTEQTIMRLSKDWLERCDAIVLTPGWKGSQGTLDEIEFAKKHDIKIFRNIKALKEYKEEA